MRTWLTLFDSPDPIIEDDFVLLLHTSITTLKHLINPFPQSIMNIICYSLIFRAFTLSIFTCSFLFGSTQSVSPFVVNSTGGTSTIDGLVVEWNVGETVIHTANAGDAIVTFGQLQPTDIIISVDELKTEWNISVFPNPMREDFQIICPDGVAFEASIHDLKGQFLSGQKLYSRNLINVRLLANGNYFLRVTNTSTNETKTIQITKSY